MADKALEEQRASVPYSEFITSSSSSGILMRMDVFIQPDQLGQYIKIVTPAVHKMREYPELLFVELSKNPEDSGHIRVLHGWTKDSKWFRENIEKQPWFGEYISELVKIKDDKRARVIQHFDRIEIK